MSVRLAASVAEIPEIRCSRCGLRYVASAWRELDQVGTLTSTDVRAIVTDWPRSAVVEVRACRGCGGNLARIRPAPLEGRISS
jgi:hypothetical protein